jgi:hypothetical protein
MSEVLAEGSVRGGAREGPAAEEGAEDGRRLLTIRARRIEEPAEEKSALAVDRERGMGPKR